MKSLYESILDADVESQEMPTVGCTYSIINLTLENSDWTDVNITSLFDWRKIQFHCRKNKWNVDSKWKYNKIPIGEIPTVIAHSQLLGFEQNIAGDLRMFLKKGINIIFHESYKLPSSHTVLVYRIATDEQFRQGDYTEMSVYLRKLS